QSDNAKAQQHHESVAETRRLSTQDHCSGTDDGDTMDIDSKSQLTEKTLLPSPLDARDSDGSDNNDDDDNDSTGSGDDQQTEDAPNTSLDTLTGIFGGRGSFNTEMLGFGFGHMSGIGNASQLRSLVAALKQIDDSTAQFVPLQELVELLAISTEDTFISINVSELVQVLVNILRGSDCNANGSPDSILLACRCLSNLLEALPLSGSIMCRHGAIEALCSKLFEIEYIDLAEQALLTLEHLSASFPDKICEAGGMSACLTFLDFFPTSVQRSALTCATNCAKSVTSTHFSQAKDTLQVLERTMFSDEQSIASLSCTALLYLTHAFRSSSDMIDELIPERLLKSIIEGANRDGTSFAAATCTTHLRILAIVLHSSSTRSIQALDSGIIHMLKSVVAHELMISESTSAPAAGQQLTNISEQAWCALHLMVTLLPQLPVDQQSFSQAEKIISRDPEHCDENLYAFDVQLRRLAATITRPAIMEQLQELFVPLAIRVFTATVDTVARYRLLQTVLTIVFIVDAESLRATLDNVRLVPFIANTMSAVDSPILLGIAMLIVRIVLGKLPGIFEADFIREGIAESLESLASSARATLEQMDNILPEDEASGDKHTDEGSDADSNKYSSSEPASSADEQHHDPHSIISGFNMVCVQLSTASRSVLITKLQKFASISSGSNNGGGQGTVSKKHRALLKWTLSQAQELYDALSESDSRTQHRSGDDVLSRLKELSKQSDQAGASHERVALCMTDLAKIITSESGITCYELTHSGIVESLSRSLRTLSDKAVSDQSAKAALDSAVLQLFDYHTQSESTQSLSTTAYAILIQRLQEALCLTERLQVFDARKSAADEAKPPIHMLAKHVRFMVSPSNSLSTNKPEHHAAEKDFSPELDEAAMSRIRQSLHPVTIGVHAISTFGVIEAYLRPRVALCIGTRKKAHRTAGLPTRDGESSVYLANRGDSIHGARPHESQLERHTGNDSSDNGSDAQLSEDDRSDADSNAGHLRLLQMIAQSSGIDLGSVGMLNSLDSQGSDDESHESDDDGNGMDNGDGNSLEEDHVSERGQTTSGLYSTSATSARSGVKPDWRLVMVLKVGDNERVVNESETIFGVLSDVCLRDPMLKDTMDIWSTTFSLRFHVELGGVAQAEDGQQQETSRHGQSSLDYRADKAAGPPGEFDEESKSITRLLDVLYRMAFQVRTQMSSADRTADNRQALPQLFLSHGQQESADAISKLFINSRLDSKLRQQLNIPLVVVCSALPVWCHSLTKHTPYLVSFDARLTYLRATSFGYTRSISYWQELARREARRNGRTLAEAQIPLGRIQRQKVRISRPRLLDSAFKVLEMYGSAKTVLEIEYFDEAGVGNGPTLEFYSLVSRCLQETVLAIWRDEGGCYESPQQYVNAPLGLFPRVLGTNKATKGDTAFSSSQQSDSESASSSDRSVKVFQFIGHFVAKALIDNRILDLPLHEEFWVAVQRHSQEAPSGTVGHTMPWTWGQLERLDAQFAGSLRYLQRFVLAKNEIYASKDLCIEEKQRRVREFRDPKSQGSVEDLELDFTYPGDPTIELRPGGTDIPVTINNVDAYIDLVAQWTLHTGVCTQIAAFCEGFNRIFPVSSLLIFTPSELCTIFGPSKDSEDWSVATITNSIELGDGYSLTSPTVQMMVRFLESLSVAERRDFLRFSTGSPRLPIGGFRALNPPLRLVLKANEPPLMPDNYLPSVMTCNNLIKMPMYSSFEVLKNRWNQAVSEGCHSFHLS
ncbi:Ubiquitin fusion degradation protein 4, partial [Coemansia sp. RSA 1933]